MPSASTPTILVYDPGWAVVGSEPPSCRILFDHNLLGEADAVVFHVPSAPDLSKIPKCDGQTWVAWSMESDVNYPQLSNTEYMKRFDLTMTYRFDSDIPVAYFSPKTCEAILCRPLPKSESAPAVYMASNAWDRSGRRQYIRELMEYLPVDSYGKCFNNRPLVEDKGAATRLDIYSRYRFTLAFENSRTQDYVTEKFFDPLKAGSIPVYYGAPNIADFAPGDHCFVDVQQFHCPRDLARYLLQVASNEDEYQAYFAWKQRPFAKAFLSKVDQVSSPPFWRLCAILHESHGDKPLGRDPVHKAARWMERFRQAAADDRKP